VIRVPHRIILVAIALLTGLLQAGSAHALTPANSWSKQFGGGPGDTGNDGGYSVTIDAGGNVLVTGYFRGTVNFGGSNLASAGGTDIFVAKYSPTGVHQWSQRFGSTSDDFGQCVTADPSGNVLVTGSFTGTVNFGGGNLVSAGGTDIFVAKYNSTGVHQWSQRFGSTFTDSGQGIVTAPGGAIVYVTGYFMGTVDFGGGNLVSVNISKDIFVAAYGSTGLHLWSQRFGGISIDTGYSVATDWNASVIVTGSFGGAVNFGGASGLGSAGLLDIFVAKYSSGGGHLWSQGFGSTSDDEGRSIATDASGNVVVTGSFAGTVNFGGGNRVGAGGKDIFVAKYNSAGAHQWSQQAGGTTDDVGQSIDTDAAGNVYATGFFTGTADFGGTNLVSGGLEDIFVTKYSTAGAYQYRYRFGSIGSTTSDKGFSIAADATGHLAATGYFSGTVDFGSGSFSSPLAQDIFVARYATEPSEPIISSIGDIGNDQGHQVKVVFDRSGRDDAAALVPVIRYEAYRRIDAPPSALAAGDPSDLSGRQLLDQGWIQVGTVDGHGKSEYSMDVPTIGDSTVALGQYRSTFFVRGATSNSFTFFDSPPDSGYSLDNLAPGVPSSFVYDAPLLSWHESSTNDLDHFTVYGSNTDSFGAATVVDYSVTPSMDVTSSPYVIYYVTATDFSGNEGKPAKVNTLSGVGGTPKSYVLSVSNYPNPFNPRTTVSYTVPSRANVTVAIYDTRGAFVATLVNAEKAAGAYSIEWDGRTASGATVSSGVYFARIEHASGTRSKKMVLLK
jgi:hypothetical protein